MSQHTRTWEANPGGDMVAEMFRWTILLLAAVLPFGVVLNAAIDGSLRSAALAGQRFLLLLAFAPLLIWAVWLTARSRALRAFRDCGGGRVELVTNSGARTVAACDVSLDQIKLGPVLRVRKTTPRGPVLYYFLAGPRSVEGVRTCLRDHAGAPGADAFSRSLGVLFLAYIVLCAAWLARLGLLFWRGV